MRSLRSLAKTIGVDFAAPKLQVVRQTEPSMITGEIKSKIDAIWNAM